ncbi:MAG: ASKHA domain-containing protein [Phycisphaerae bacterium]
MEINGEIEYRHGKIKVSLAEGALVTDVVRQAGLILNTSCAGKGVCGGCAVDLLEGVYQHDGQNFIVSGGQPSRIHGCKTRIVEGPFRISIPRRSLVETGERVVADFILKEYTGFDPAIRQMKLTVPKPSLEDARGDFEHICRELREKHQIELSGGSLSAFRRLSWAVREGNYHIKIYLAWIDDRWELLAVEPIKDGLNKDCFGLAVDIGTTTVAVSLVDIAKGKITDTVTCYNQQIQQADDVAARIVYAGTDEGLLQMQRLIIDQTINPLIQMLCKRHHIDCHNIMRMVVSGNTVMWNLFLAIDPTPIGVVPFQPVCRDPGTYRARDLNLAIYPDAPVDIVPSISAYVGGDIVSDIETSRLMKTNQFALMIDIGTNGEIAVSDGKQVLVTACAAGPAFEGLRISHGMRASVGAIEQITLGEKGNKCHCKVIGGGKPVGICGSGLIDFLAQAFRVGLVTNSGRFQRQMLDQCPRLRMVSGAKFMLEYVVAERDQTEDADHEITVTEKDIETLLQAKAAIFAALNLLIKRTGKTFNDLENIYLAGGFAKYINIENAITIGLLPEIDLHKYVVIGNGSLAGAYLAMIDRNVWQTFRQTIDLPKVVELNLDPNFQDEYTFALFLPNMQEELFSKTMAKLQTI